MENTTAAPRHPKFVRWALLLGIVVILNIFFWRVIALALPEPKYETFCPVSSVSVQTPTDAASCAAVDGVWTEYPDYGTTAPKAVPAGYCECKASGQAAYQEAQNQHSLYAFGFMVALGILSLIAGFMPIGSSIVSSGLSYGGVVALIVGSAQYWSSAGKWAQLLIAGLGLAVLLYIGWKRFKD